MKKLHQFALSILSAGTAFFLMVPSSASAGDNTYYYGKQPAYGAQTSAAACYHGGFEFGLFGAGIFPGDDTDLESALGAGVSLGYFFNENFGVDFGAQFFSTDSEVQNYTLDAVYRFPIQDACVAPYLFTGLGLHSNGVNTTLFRVGAGIDFNLSDSMSLFTDGAYNVVGDEVENYPTIRAGIRFRF